MALTLAGLWASPLDAAAPHLSVRHLLPPQVRTWLSGLKDPSPHTPCPLLLSWGSSEPWAIPQWGPAGVGCLGESGNQVHFLGTGEWRLMFFLNQPCGISFIGMTVLTRTTKSFKTSCVGQMGPIPAWLPVSSLVRKLGL